MDKNLKAALIQDALTPQLVELIGQSAHQLDNLHQILLTDHSTIQTQLTQLDELSRQMMDLGYAFDSSKNDEFFYLPPDAFSNPSFQIDLRYFMSPDGKSARYMVFHDGEALTPKGSSKTRPICPPPKKR